MNTGEDRPSNPRLDQGVPVFDDIVKVAIPDAAFWPVLAPPHAAAMTIQRTDFDEVDG